MPEDLWKKYRDKGALGKALRSGPKKKPPASSYAPRLQRSTHIAESFRDVRLVAATEKALLVAVSGKEVWFPKSQVKQTNLAKPGDVGFIVVPSWLAIEKGIR